MSECRSRGIKHLDLVLGEMADAQLAGTGDRSFERRKPARKKCGQGGFPLAIGTEKGDAVIRVDPRLDVREHRPAVIADGNLLQRQRRRGHRFRVGEGEAGLLGQGRRGDLAEPLDHLQPRLGLPRLGGLGTETIDEGLQMGLHLGLAARFGRGVAQSFRMAALEFVITAGVEGQPAALEMEDVTDGAVEQVAVMADEEDGVRVAGEIAFEPECPFEVEIVGRLIEKEQIGFGAEYTGKGHAHAPTA